MKKYEASGIMVEALAPLCLKPLFIIKKENEQLFRECIGNRISDKIEVVYCFQDVNDLPEGFSLGMMKELEKGFVNFLKNEMPSNPVKAEFYLPFMANDLVEAGKADVTVLTSKDKWYGVTVGVNAGHGTSGSYNYQTYCHPDRTPKVTGGTTAAGSIIAVAVSSGMTFYDGTPESTVNLVVAQKLRDKLLDYGYNVLMIRDGDDVQLDNVARTVICNNMADCHLAIHFDGDGLSYDKGAFFMSVPDALKYMDPVSYTWEKSEAFGWSIIEGLTNVGVGINGSGNMDMDLTQTSYSTVASIDVELGNASSDHSDYYTDLLAEGLLNGINIYFDK